MLLQNIINILEEMAPLAYAEDFDNVGLLVGNPTQSITGILVCHDALEQVVDEAIAKNANLIVCFHPILFKGLKKITGKNYVEKAILKAIKNDIAIYAVHTALDNHTNGVNKIMCDALGILNPQILIPKDDFIYKLTTYTPQENAQKVREALFGAGAGAIGNYDNCSFSTLGEGTYRGNEQSNPTIGVKNQFTTTPEVKIEVVFEKYLQKKIISALFAAHIYEEVAYQITPTKNKHQQIGLGMIGTLAQPMSEIYFLNFVKKQMKIDAIRHTALLEKPVQKIAVLGGSGAFAIDAALSQKADMLITADLKYHDFFRAENKIILVDIGHYESERYTKNYIIDYLIKKIPNFAIGLSNHNTNPVKYL